MKPLTKAPYGTWETPLMPVTLTSRRVRISGLRIDGVDTYWIEHRLNEGGRHVLLRRQSNGVIGEILPMTPDYQLMDVQINVNGYNGRAYAVQDSLIVANQISDGRVYKYDLKDSMRTMVPLTPRARAHYGDFDLDLNRGILYAVEELHEDNVTNRLVAIPLDGSAARDASAIKVLSDSSDFVATPALSPDGKALAWTSWEHPHMPWTQSALHVGKLTDSGELDSFVTLVDEEDVCVYEPRWGMSGDLLHIDDSNGWANFYRTEGFNFNQGAEWAAKLKTRLVHPAQRAFSSPQWELGKHSYDNFSLDEIICSWSYNGHKRMGVMNIKNGQLEETNFPWHPCGNVVCENGRLVFLGESATDLPSIVEIRQGEAIVLRNTADLELDTENISLAQPISWRSSDGVMVHGFFYAPRNHSYMTPQDEQPPLVVNVHHGPTYAAKTGLSWEVQFWTTRGFAYLDVDYRGSTGYGKVYREALNGNWGLMDSQDVIEGVQYVTRQGWVDPERIVLRGFSSGAMTAMNAMRQSDKFKAISAVSGFWDIKGLEQRTNKFESFLVQRLLDGKENAYEQVSPINHVEEISGEVLIFQAEDEAISSAAETKLFVSKLQEAEIPVELHLIAGETHNMQNKASIEQIFERELAFFTRVLNLG
ncbi:alpha/beta hydrolase family protein [Boudabousia marimammalium]|uniref:Peptidase S9 prolyl oligopeptidase catalytic domain-containing protein n=1 Tax=Boudabousia marimammalium TaxID=156892 RepID=A0A1Q5PQZ2_9ACTO|nr:prolyl oligopeptidase family serine peptidase [Boudabousia marimammalium]OKL49956.1 hypothetical protein BM477_03360 [Boudabousia marimammalium]